MRRKRTPAAHKPYSLRIIAGTLRRRRIKPPSHLAVRPTGDRIRETLFSWLQPVIQDAHCLDLFGGSGILGFEALSRGAAHVTCVDHNSQVIHAIAEHAHALGLADRITCLQADAAAFLLQPPSHSWNVVFLDPPFDRPVLSACCEQLVQTRCLAPRATVYLEYAKRAPDPKIPAIWQSLKCQTAGRVRYRLMQAP